MNINVIQEMKYIEHLEIFEKYVKTNCHAPTLAWAKIGGATRY